VECLFSLLSPCVFLLLGEIPAAVAAGGVSGGTSTFLPLVEMLAKIFGSHL